VDVNNITMANLGKSKIKDMYSGAKPEIFRLANYHRKNLTDAEKILWNCLRKFRNEGFVFRKQHPVVFFIADFYCHKLILFIEVDGDYHLELSQYCYDENRSAELERYGIKVLRFKNEEIINRIDKVLSEIKNSIGQLSSPSPLGEGDRRG